ncbi:MAG: phytanoyl-CoA dioxygenase family protein [Chloroflexota bacterium]
MLAPVEQTSSYRHVYDEKGYVIIRDVVDADLAAETVDHVHWLLEKNPGVRPEQLHHHLLANDPFMHRLVCDDRLLDIVEQFIGPNIAMFGAHYIAKRPHKGQAVGWHQDGSYWPLEPMEVTTLWLAGNPSSKENGCMRVIPGSQNDRLLKPREMIEVDTDDFVLNRAIHPSQIDDSDAVDIELNAGDVSMHNPNIIHGSNANTSDEWRVGLTLRYIPTSTWVKRETQENIFCRGDLDPSVNNTYAVRPQFDPEKHMAFRGCETWNDA